MSKQLAIYGVLMTVIFSCGEGPKPTVDAKESVQPENSAAAIVYTVDPSSSGIVWEGYKGVALGKAQHSGTVKVNSGKVYVNNNTVTGGEFSFPLESLDVTDIPADDKNNAKLRNHLLSGDFFDAATHPAAKFVITTVEPKNTDSVLISGNLTLRGTEKNITFPAAIALNDSSVTASSQLFYINRKDWEMHYKSENSLGDDLIRPEIGIQLNIKANK